ncbi:EamA family transporter RarD [Glutamicibacter sp. MNS18]|uniref:EamA family transporter RarD n=1 Tax=Glutamicibacter sp. MNS18 TaxID=2989817 RepID=UPI002235B455|nr:EamA family transporter RarD [Glutamicibacter sp. MNS18]MCW4464096.1 EamA family transporter RarD [Glutamicibacter sp. MNS18]
MNRAVAATPRSPRSIGILQGTSAYLIWGLLPLYFLLLPQISAFEFVAVRIVFSLLFCFLLLALTRQVPALIGILRDRRTTGRLVIASVLIAVNWTLYAFAVLTGHVLEASLGYFINPLVAIALGVLVLKEKLTGLQWVAIGFALVAVVVLSLGLGRMPWISLGLAFSFGLYGLVKNQVGQKGTALATLSVETIALTPLALVFVLILAGQGQSALANGSAATFWLLTTSGVITAVPLILFGGAARRLPLSTLGSLQFLAPIGQFLLGLFVFHEVMQVERWVGFILVWIAVVLIIIDMVRAPGTGNLPEPKSLP